MTIVVTIAGVDRTDYVTWPSLNIERVLTRAVDTCRFLTLRTATKTWKPTAGAEIVITADGTKIFGGVIIRVTERPKAYALLEYEVECTDYARILDSKLVATTYENQTVNDIIADLAANHFDAGVFTVNNVDCAVVINYIQFNYIPGAEVLTKLAEMVGYDWFVDYDRDINFFKPQPTTAPVDIEDDTGTYEYASLILRDDNSQVRNTIYVRGGEYEADTFTAVMPIQAARYNYELPYRFSNEKCTITGDEKTIGPDGIADFDSYDILWNNDEKTIRFLVGRQPTDETAAIRFSGRPFLPVRVKLRSQAIIDAMSAAEGIGDGSYEYLILNQAINSKEGARQRARQEIETYGQTMVEGEFNTNTAGFEPGQKVRINSTSRAVDSYYIVSRVRTTSRTPTELRYAITLISTKTFGFIEMLRRLLIQQTDQIILSENELLDLMEAADETVTVMDETVTGNSNPQSEAITIGESSSGQQDYGVEFVLSPVTVRADDTPSGTKRVFNLDGSPLSPYL